MDIKTTVKDTMVKMLKLRPEEVQDDVKLYEGIGVDSTEMVELVIALEKVFSTKLSPKEITKFCTLNDIERIIQGKLSVK